MLQASQKPPLQLAFTTAFLQVLVMFLKGLRKNSNACMVLCGGMALLQTCAKLQSASSLAYRLGFGSPFVAFGARGSMVQVFSFIV
jgi:hypothetical protein